MDADNRAAVYLDPDAPLEARVQDLVSRMTLEEKVSQMSADAAAIPRLGVPKYHWWNECLHGVGRAGRATVFPQSIGLAATWDEELVFDVATAISDEARAKHHQAVRQGNRVINLGLTFWSPTINIFRDPRWGRGQETYGEDPFLTGKLGVQFVRGLQGNDPKYLKLVATPKHFAVHSGPEIGRLSFDASCNPKDMEETYLPAFRMCVQEAGAWSVMGAYNRLNGTPCCADPSLLDGKLRAEWGFRGFVVSDCGAVENICREHRVAGSVAEAAAMAVQAGCDLCCGTAYQSLVEAVEKGFITEEAITKAVTRLFEARFRLGMFDPEDRVPYAGIPASVVDCAEHRLLARRAAQESIVLLKNDGTLPLRKDLGQVLVTGPGADAIDVLLGNYNGHSGRLVTILEGIVGRASIGTRVFHYPGCLWAGPETERFGAVQWDGPDADAIIACLGLTPKMEGEEGDEAMGGFGGDRAAVELPGSQRSFLKWLVGTGKPVVLVLTGGSPIALPPEADGCAAILFAWYPGEEGGNAVADVVFGDANPSGRLPITFPRIDQPLPDIRDYSMENRTYRFCGERPAFSFGFGLSYTEFAYSGLSVAQAGDGLRVSVDVQNVGAMAGSEVVQVYLRDVQASTRVPLLQLVAFGRMRLLAGQKRTISFDVARKQLEVVLEDGSRRFEPGQFEILVGGTLPVPDVLARGRALSAFIEMT